MRRLVLLAIVLGLGSLLVAGFLGRHHLLERWYLAQLESDDPASRLNAIARLAEIRSTRAVPQLAHLLRRVGDDEKKAILEAYAVMGPYAAEAAPALVKLIDDSLAWRTSPSPIRVKRNRTPTSLTRIGPPESIADGAVEALAIRALEAMGPAALPFVLDESLHRGQDRIHWRIAYFTATRDWSARHLLDLVTGECPRKSAVSREILRAVGPGVVPQLAALLSSDVPPLRRWTAEVIWDFSLGQLREIEKSPAGLGRLIDPALRGSDLSQAAVDVAAEIVELGEGAREALVETREIAGPWSSSCRSASRAPRPPPRSRRRSPERARWRGPGSRGCSCG